MIQEQLKNLVSSSVKTLGFAVKEIHGEPLFREIEVIRKRMKIVRGKDAQVVEEAMQEVYRKLEKVEDERLRLIAKSFSLMLELINTCETAFRSHRLEGHQIPNEAQRPESIIYVFTSHPTESRSAPYLKLLNHVEDLLILALKTDFACVQDRLLHFMKIAVRLHLANNKRPQVKDEMEEIFQTVLGPEILSEQIALSAKGTPISFRTWVGGDKDGHPLVGAMTMGQSLQLSRSMILSFVVSKMKSFEEELKWIEEGKRLKPELVKVKTNLHAMKKIKNGDGKKVKSFRISFEKLLISADKNQFLSPILIEIKNLLWLYPALVLPLEIREDSSLIRHAVEDKKEPISLMLKTLKAISKGYDPKWYVRGFIISMCMTSEDYLAAVHITIRELGALDIPIVPLFENEKGLKNGKSILEGAMKKHPIVKIHREKWGRRFEVMVGYSDSSKENGVLPSRLMVETALFDLESFLESKELTPVFFHGSGGSTSRGGGTVQEQISWWPQSALNIFKVTIQGEMVQRNFNNHFIMRSQIGKILESYARVVPKRPHVPKELMAFVDGIQIEYRDLVNDSSFQDLTSAATPYQYLDLLRIGSRPSKRAALGKFSLRAIPWILCWTQTRLVLPVWWGTGTGWKILSLEQKKAIKAYYKTSPLMQSYVKNLGFTFARVELGVWNFHLHVSSLSEEEKKKWEERITEEFNLSVEFFKEISGESEFTWFRPWLAESIYFRSSMIHPLNVIQKIALERKDHVLLRESVTGIACGMLTTG
jgi:phosphoenolpyruvate carboxylase